MRNMAQRTIAMKIRELLFGIIYLVEFLCRDRYLGNYDHIKVSKLVKHEILIHYQFNIYLLLQIGRK